jgi:septal ring factor EnvC (AmiA/AmiB activator)
MLANMLATLEQMDKRHAETAKRLDAIEASIAGINAELKGTGKRLNAIDKKLAK